MELKEGDLVRLDPRTTRYPDEISNPWDEYGIISVEQRKSEYSVKWFNGKRNGSYRYFGENSPHNDLIHIPHKERCPVIYTRSPVTGLSRVEIYSIYLMNKKVLTTDDYLNEENHKIKNQLNEFFNTFREKYNHLGMIQYVDCYYKNNLRWDARTISLYYDSDRTGSHSEPNSPNIKRYTNLGKDFILLDKIEIPHDQSLLFGTLFDS